MTEPNDFNSRITNEFRANGGKVGPRWRTPLSPAIAQHGREKRQERVSPLGYQAVNGGYAIFASKAGAPGNPDWCHNLLANPRASVEIGTGTVDVTARVADPEERERIWSRQKEAAPQFEYERQAAPRQIPLVILEPGSSH